MLPKARRFPLRPGMTLVELLMVLVIVVILLAVIAPLMRVGTQDRRLREAARQVNAYLAGAQARAAERGRPVFVEFDRKDNYCLKLSMAEVPPPYTGDTTTAMATAITGTGTGPWVVNFSSGGVSALITRNLVADGGVDRIRFNFQGHLYPILSRTENSVTIGNPLNGDAAGYPPIIPSSSPGLTFQIFRSPMPSSAAPLVLPVGTAIDYSKSGIGKSTADFDDPGLGDTKSVLVGFSPSAGVSKVQFSGGVMVPAAVHFLIGRIDRVGASPGNLADPDAIWISVNPTTGICTTTDNKASTTVAAAREYANLAQNLGGR